MGRIIVLLSQKGGTGVETVSEEQLLSNISDTGSFLFLFFFFLGFFFSQFFFFLFPLSLLSFLSFFLFKI